MRKGKKAPRKPSGTGKTPEIVINVLGYREEDKWVALALEMDIRGYGKTYEKALEKLAELVLMQVSFAHFKGQPETIRRPADPIWFERFAEVRNQRLQHITEEARSRSDFQIGGVPIPPPHVIAAMKSRFQPIDG